MSKSNNNIFPSKDQKKNLTDLDKEINEFKNIDKTDIINKEKVQFKNKKNNFWNFLIYVITFKNKKNFLKYTKILE